MLVSQLHILNKAHHSSGDQVTARVTASGLLRRDLGSHFHSSVQTYLRDGTISTLVSVVRSALDLHSAGI